MTNIFITYDLETYPNVFTCAAKRLDTSERWLFEISDRRNDAELLRQFLTWCSVQPSLYMVGYNSIKFDYPILHEFMVRQGSMGVAELYLVAQSRIEDKSKFDPVPQWKQLIPQIDLMKLNHFDNVNKRTSLKQIEFNYRIPNIIDLPFKPGSTLNHEQKDELIHYNMYGDVDNTERLLIECMPDIEFRLDQNPKLVSANDGKLGERELTDRLKELGYTLRDDAGEPINTKRENLPLADVIFDYHNFEQPEFNRVMSWLKKQTLTKSQMGSDTLVTKGLFKDLAATVEGFDYVFGLGGIHGSVSSTTLVSDDDIIIEDWDVASYYPNLAIANRLYPQHLGSEFCEIYRQLYVLRQKYSKKDYPRINALLKLALNTVYGNSNNKYSVFYDPAYTMATTINGQLLLCKLSEELIKVDGLKIVQINTDGLTVSYPRKNQNHVHAICNWWEKWTCLQLENAEYSRMFIRDVNNYIAEYTNGELKNKGAYSHKRAHHQDQSALIIPKVAELALINGADIESTVRTWPDFYDFQIKARGTNGGRVVYGGKEQQRLCRYYVSHGGESLKIERPPPRGKIEGDYKKAPGVSNERYYLINKTGEYNPEIHTKSGSVYGTTSTDCESGYTVTLTNNIITATNPINYDYYIDRVKKLVEPLRGII